MTRQFEPMSVGQILDLAFKLYRQNFVRYVTIVAVVMVPAGLLFMVPLNIMQNWEQTRGGDISGQAEGFARLAEGSGALKSAPAAPTPQQAITMLGFLVVGMVLLLFGYQISQGALFKSVSESYLDREVSVGEAYRFALPKIWSILGASILVGIITMLGACACIVPGIIFALWFCLTVPAIIAEDQGALGALSRSKALVAGNLGKALLIVFLAGLITSICSWVFQFAGKLLAVGTLHAGAAMPAAVIESLFGVAGQALATPFAAASMVLFYYDLRIRKEGFDLEMLANRFAGQGGPDGGGPR